MLRDSREPGSATELGGADRTPGLSSAVLGVDGEATARVDLGRAWRLLSEPHQEALALAVWDGLTAAEAAAVLGISPVAYRLRLSRARKVLRAHLGIPTLEGPPPDRPHAARATGRRRPPR